MNKQELIHLNGLAQQIQNYLMEEDDQYNPGTDWEEYPERIDLRSSKTKHETAVKTKFHDISQYLEEEYGEPQQPVSPTVDYDKKQYSVVHQEE